MKLKIIITFLLLGIAVISCTDNTSSGTMTNVPIPNADYADPNDFISKFSHTNKIGTITFQYDFNRYYSADSVYGDWYKYFAVYSTFHRVGDISKKIPSNGVYVNGRQVNLNSYESLNYFAYSYYSENQAATGSLFNVNDTNRIEILESPLIPGYDSIIKLGSPLELFTPVKSSIISSKNDLVIKWDSLHTKFVQINLLALNTGNNTISATTYLADKSEFIIPASVLSKFPKGGISITVAETEVYYIYFNNGTEIPLFYQTSNTFDMKLTD